MSKSNQSAATLPVSTQIITPGREEVVGLEGMLKGLSVYVGLTAHVEGMYIHMLCTSYLQVIPCVWPSTSGT